MSRSELLVLLHGLGQTPQTFQDQVRDLPPDLPAAAPWLSGLRPGDAESFELDRAANQVSTELTSYGAARAYLVGISLGAMVALRVAATDPRVGALVLVAPQIAPPKMVMKAQRAALRFVPERRLASQGISKKRVLQVLDSMLEMDLSGDLERIDVPTLVLLGDTDRVNRAAGHQLTERMSDAKLTTLHGGQELNIDSPDEFNVEMYRFIGEHRA
ncbi:alpha/beta fold hydrolase [Granulicoccus phenolivorans]|uniref:alpha/beta fold hydrolase n=1 Tax=Granulicoccus phenolivorans TaxID=266854 RepID=UPI0004106075|nr:alpha/beta hydrolase [Granulicoccus phenolivorans]